MRPGKPLPVLAAVACAALLHGCAAVMSSNEPLRNGLIPQVQQGMSREQVTAVLGPPDEAMAFDNTRPAASDRIDDTLDYKAVSKRLIAFVGESRFELVETLAERCAALIREEFGVAWLRLKLSKPGAVTGARAVGVVIERGHRP